MKINRKTIAIAAAALMAILFGLCAASLGVSHIAVGSIGVVLTGFVIGLILKSDSEHQKSIMEFSGKVAAISKSNAVVEFNMDGTILDANENFLNTIGYALDEIQGNHHRMFCEPGEADSLEYRQFWERLNRGEFIAETFKRITKSGKEIYLQATYNPIRNQDGKLYKVVKFAMDVTEERLKSMDYSGQISAIHKSNAVIEFNMDGTIREANENFLNTMGYSMEEIQGRHHKIFCDADYASSADYKMFWDRLNRGEFMAETFKRITKDGKEIYLQATYNPINGIDGTPVKVVKFALDVTDEKMMAADFSGQLEAIGKSNAVIEFNMDGTIRTANEVFLQTTEYRLDEIKGNHHRMFCETQYANSQEYRQFWDQLNQGQFISETFKRITKSGKEIYLQATYNPIKDVEGKPYKVVKFASDVTAEKVRAADFEGQLEAINKSNAVIEFNMDGTIVWANDNFLDTVKYKLEEIQGKHHRIFCEPGYSNSAEYKLFWDRLNRGEFISETFKRMDKNGDDIYLQATYNPIKDLNGVPYKVVKYAIDVTEQKEANMATEMAAKEVSRVISALDEGDLTQRYSIESVGELGKMGASLNKALQKLGELIGTIITSAESLGSASSQMSGSSQEMSQASTEQASSVEEISSSMEQMLANIQQNNNNAQETEKIASKAAKEIMESNESVEQTVTSMKPSPTRFRSSERLRVRRTCWPSTQQ